MKFNSILLLGATGTGKTPLGNFIEKNGLLGKKCFHFDFGESLRESVFRTKATLLDDHEMQYLTNVLEKGLLLEDKDFPIAEKILRSFIQQKQVTHDDILILNGLPRHKGQAESLDNMV